MPRRHRSALLKVTGGRVLRKNRWTPTHSANAVARAEPIFTRLRPGRGYRHLVTRPQMRAYVEMLPRTWTEGVNVFLLDEGWDGLQGWWQPGLVAISAWPRSLVDEWDPEFYKGHRRLLSRLGVRARRVDDEIILDFDVYTARAFSLVHVLVHELGHQRDFASCKGGCTARGENYAERFALELEDRALGIYEAIFGSPRR